MRLHVTYNFQMHRIRQLRYNTPYYELGHDERSHDTIADTLCGVSVCYFRKEEKNVLFDPKKKPLTCIICIAETCE